MMREKPIRWMSWIRIKVYIRNDHLKLHISV